MCAGVRSRGIHMHAIMEYAQWVSRAAMQFRSQAYLSDCLLFSSYSLQSDGRMSACATLRVHSIPVFGISVHILQNSLLLP